MAVSSSVGSINLNFNLLPARGSVILSSNRPSSPILFKTKPKGSAITIAGCSFSPGPMPTAIPEIEKSPVKIKETCILFLCFSIAWTPAETLERVKNHDSAAKVLTNSGDSGLLLTNAFPLIVTSLRCFCQDSISDTRVSAARRRSYSSIPTPLIAHAPKSSSLLGIVAFFLIHQVMLRSILFSLMSLKNASS